MARGVEFTLQLYRATQSTDCHVGDLTEAGNTDIQYLSKNKTTQSNMYNDTFREACQNKTNRDMLEVHSNVWILSGGHEKMLIKCFNSHANKVTSVPP